MKIDAHQHFWMYDADKHGWIDDTMHAIQKDFTPQMLEPVLHRNGFDGCVTVQVDQTEDETLEMVGLAQAHSFIKGVVGWVDLQAHQVEERLEYFAQYPIIKGFRHIVQAETDPHFLSRPQFRNGISKLRRFGFTYDILIFPHQLQSAIDFAKAFPQQPFVLDHLAKPYIKKGLIDEWRKDVQALAALDNVWCKVSGLVTEADWKEHRIADFTPYIETAAEAFGMDRLMYGSDWPVCLVAASYEHVVVLAQHHVQSYSPEEQAKFFGGNAVRFYQLNKH